MGYFRLILCTALLTLFSGCSVDPFDHVMDALGEMAGPDIVRTNFSDDLIYNVRVRWGRGSILTVGQYSMPLSPGIGATQKIYFPDLSDFDEPLELSWENAQKEKFSRTFHFTDHAIRQKNRKTGAYPYIRFLFTQNDVSYVTHLTPGEAEKWEEVKAQASKMKIAYHRRIRKENAQ